MHRKAKLGLMYNPLKPWCSIPNILIDYFTISWGRGDLGVVLYEHQELSLKSKWREILRYWRESSASMIMINSNEIFSC